MILIDTSVWVEWLCGRMVEAAADEVLERAVVCGPVLQEILQGTRAQDVRRTASLFEALPRVCDPLPERLFLHAAEIYRVGRQAGYTIRTPHDCLIAAIAIDADVPIWHRDQDFDHIAQYTELRVYRHQLAAG